MVPLGIMAVHYTAPMAPTPYERKQASCSYSHDNEFRRMLCVTNDV